MRSKEDFYFIFEFSDLGEGREMKVLLFARVVRRGGRDGMF